MHSESEYDREEFRIANFDPLGKKIKGEGNNLRNSTEQDKGIYIYIYK
jgi:hypothetical protein